LPEQVSNPVGRIARPAYVQRNIRRDFVWRRLLPSPPLQQSGFVGTRCQLVANQGAQLNCRKLNCRNWMCKRRPQFRLQRTRLRNFFNLK
jgi:hypothetical protein